ncbi:MAG TPA: NfeD family protein [Burkholderiaceae bacterium]|nr:NfeD family protein [Burkholderiaceae bacterium]
MSGWVWWFVLAFGLLIAELLTGTFFLLMVAIALAAAGVADLFGASFVLQLLIAAAIGLGGALWLRKTRFGRIRHDPADVMQNIDVGQTVQVAEWAPTRTARVNYRGAQWDVELAPGEDPVAGEFVIKALHANRLVVARRRG